MFKLNVGLTGGIASGKSLVASFFTELGAIVIDYDVLARLVVEPGSPVLAELVSEFGREILQDGELNRTMLAGIVFSNPSALARLNEITHPAVGKLAAELVAAAPSRSIIIHEIPLLVETKAPETFDAVVVVDVPVEQQIARLKSRNSLDREQAIQRIKSQASREKRLQRADFVIDNTGSESDTKQQVQVIWERLNEVLRLKCASR